MVEWFYSIIGLPKEPTAGTIAEYTTWSMFVHCDISFTYILSADHENQGVMMGWGGAAQESTQLEVGRV